MINEQDRINHFESNDQIYLDQLKNEYDNCLRNQNYALAKQYDIQISENKQIMAKNKFQQLKRARSTEMKNINEEYDIKKALLIQKWNAKADELDEIVSQKENNLRMKHEMERAFFIEYNQKYFYNTYNTRFYPMNKALINNVPKEYLDILKAQKMIFKGSNKDYEFAEHLKKLGKKALIEDSQKKMLRIKKESTIEYQKLMRKQELEMKTLMCDIENNVQLATMHKEKEFEMLEKEFKYKFASLNKIIKMDEVKINKIMFNGRNLKRCSSVILSSCLGK